MKFPPDILRQCCFLAGPTAVGKTKLSLHLAQQLDAEILSLDSMAIYTGMDIGTAKPSPEERRRVPHHLIDLVHPSQDFSTAEYLNAALHACRDILARGRRPLFVGGTGLYLRAILRGVFEGPPADWDVRNELEARSKTNGPQWLWQQLFEIDPVSAKRLHPNDARRLVRALEIFQLTGSPASQQQSEVPLPVDERPRFVFWLHPPRDWLYERINRRVEQMFQDGLIEETKSLLADDPPPGRTARQALGYREVIDLLEGGLPDIPSACELIQTRTRQFAKRQHTWFRNLEECREVPLTGMEDTATICDRIDKLLADSPQQGQPTHVENL